MEQKETVNGEEFTIEYMADECPNNCSYCKAAGLLCIYEIEEESRYKEATDDEAESVFGGI